MLGSEGMVGMGSVWLQLGQYTGQWGHGGDGVSVTAAGPGCWAVRAWWGWGQCDCSWASILGSEGMVGMGSVWLQLGQDAGQWGHGGDGVSVTAAGPVYWAVRAWWGWGQCDCSWARMLGSEGMVGMGSVWLQLGQYTGQWGHGGDGVSVTAAGPGCWAVRAWWGWGQCDCSWVRMLGSEGMVGMGSVWLQLGQDAGQWGHGGDGVSVTASGPGCWAVRAWWGWGQCDCSWARMLGTEGMVGMGSVWLHLGQDAGQWGHGGDGVSVTASGPGFWAVRAWWGWGQCGYSWARILGSEGMVGIGLVWLQLGQDAGQWGHGRDGVSVTAAGPGCWAVRAWWGWGQCECSWGRMLGSKGLLLLRTLHYSNLCLYLTIRQDIFRKERVWEIKSANGNWCGTN